MTRVGIVGAGITGLSLTHYLALNGVECVTVEAADQPGGVIESTRTADVVLEHGPQRLRLTPEIDSLVRTVELEDAVIEADDSMPLYVYAGGALRRVPFTVREFVATDLLSWRGKLRTLLEPLTGAGQPDETAAELFGRKFGTEAYENVIGPLFGGIYGSDPAEMPAEYALERVLELEAREGSLLRPALRRALSADGPPPISFESGLQQLPEAIADRYADRVELGTPVTGIDGDGTGYRLRTDAGAEAVDAVVVTARADEAARLLSGVAPSASVLDELTYNPLAVVHVRADASPRGFGYQVRADEGFHTLGVSWNASLFDRDGLYTCFLGGMRHPDVVERPPDEIGDIARREFTRVMGAEAAVINVTRIDRAVPAYDRSWAALDDLDLPDGIHLATNYTARVGVPGRIRQAAGLADRIAAEGQPG